MERINDSIRVVKVLKQVGKAIKHYVGNQFRDMNLTGPQGMLMGILAHFGQMKISDLSEKLGLSNSTVSGIIDRLEKQGLVERVRSQEDRRVVYVNVTPEYKRTTQENFREMEQKFKTLMDQATSEELETIFNGLETLKMLIERQTE